eukprot:TRINITY_DN60523_c0_g1_i1.p1 TRINITY_DN60523_c0_g1~~TRINITY_DN60523_c0_g1_i1.p1  ORF type:complete len:102 (-),score=24.50 TRINITY_DN60523_c0_g1_i1:253-558(-)
MGRRWENPSCGCLGRKKGVVKIRSSDSKDQGSRTIGSSMTSSEEVTSRSSKEILQAATKEATNVLNLGKLVGLSIEENELEIKQRLIQLEVSEARGKHIIS